MELLGGLELALLALEFDAGEEEAQEDGLGGGIGAVVEQSGAGARLGLVLGFVRDAFLGTELQGLEGGQACEVEGWR